MCSSTPLVITINLFHLVSDCTTLVDPTNGNVALNGTSLGSVAQYSCNDNFMIVPENSTLRTCGVNNWDGVDPACGMFV